MKCSTTADGDAIVIVMGVRRVTVGLSVLFAVAGCTHRTAWHAGGAATLVVASAGVGSLILGGLRYAFGGLGCTGGSPPENCGEERTEASTFVTVGLVSLAVATVGGFALFATKPERPPIKQPRSVPTAPVQPRLFERSSK